MKEPKILVTGASGRIGTELTAALREKYGRYNVIAADKKVSADILLDVQDHEELNHIVRECRVTQIYHLAGTKGNEAWKLNVQSLLSVLKIAKERQLDKVFWPSSIGEPNAVYGISKQTGEYWCSYYFEQYGVDVRSLRFPGLISHTRLPDGGTTDYAIDIFHQALEKQHYTCFLAEDHCLPMLYMPDAIRATLELMDAPKENITVRTSYNIAGMSFAPCDLAAEIKKYIPQFKMDYLPDYRNEIANSWPARIKDEQARKDWGWVPEYNLAMLTRDILLKISEKKESYPDFPVEITLW